MITSIDFTKRGAHFVSANNQLVEWLLTLNTHNRVTKRDAIEAYRRDMRQGNFMLTNQGIGVSASGVLLDGQNRLLALREEGYPPVPLLIVTGLEDDAQKHVDQHARRTQADTLRLALNRPTSNLAIAALNAISIFETGKQRQKLSIDELAILLQENEELVANIISACGNIRRAAVIGALIEYAWRGTTERAMDLARQIGNGELLERTDPAYKVRDMMMRSQPTGHANMVYVYQSMISACAAHWEGKKLHSLRPTAAWPRFGDKGYPKSRLLSVRFDKPRAKAK